MRTTHRPFYFIAPRILIAVAALTFLVTGGRVHAAPPTPQVAEKNLTVLGNDQPESHIRAKGDLHATGNLSADGYVKFGHADTPCTSGTEGALRYNAKEHHFEGCNGTIWSSLDGGLSTLKVGK